MVAAGLRIIQDEDIAVATVRAYQSSGGRPAIADSQTASSDSAPRHRPIGHSAWWPPNASEASRRDAEAPAKLPCSAESHAIIGTQPAALTQGDGESSDTRRPSSEHTVPAETRAEHRTPFALEPTHGVSQPRSFRRHAAATAIPPSSVERRTITKSKARTPNASESSQPKSPSSERTVPAESWADEPTNAEHHSRSSQRAALADIEPADAA